MRILRILTSPFAILLVEITTTHSSDSTRFNYEKATSMRREGQTPRVCHLIIAGTTETGENQTCWLGVVDPMI
jgi:hypothetical protein